MVSLRKKRGGLGYFLGGILEQPRHIINGLGFLDRCGPDSPACIGFESVDFVGPWTARSSGIAPAAPLLLTRPLTRVSVF